MQLKAFTIQQTAEKQPNHQLKLTHPNGSQELYTKTTHVLKLPLKAQNQKEKLSG